MIVCDLDTTSVRTSDVLPSEKFEGSRLILTLPGVYTENVGCLSLLVTDIAATLTCCNVMLNYSCVSEILQLISNFDLYSTLHV